MAYIHIKDFKAGMDRTRDIRTAEAGSLWELKNAHLTSGGDIERSKKFVSIFDVPGTKGYASVNGVHYVFASSAVGVPAGVRLQVLAHPLGANLTEILDVEPRDGRLYVVARYSDGTVHHFYDKKRVTDWDDPRIAGTYLSLSDAAARLAEIINEEEDYTASAVGAVVTIEGLSDVFYSHAGSVEDISGNADQAVNTAIVTEAGAPLPETLAASNFKVASGVQGSNGTQPKCSVVLGTAGGGGNFNMSALVVGGVNLLSAPVIEPTVDGINNFTSVVALGINTAGTGYSAVANANVLVITGPDKSAGLNNAIPVISVDTVTTSFIAGAFYGGVDPFNRVTEITVNGVDILGAPVPFGSTTAATATAIAAQITAFVSAPNYTAVAANGVVTITAAAGSGATLNGIAPTPVIQGNISLSNINPFSGGVTAGTPTARKITATLVGTFDARDVYTITLDGQDFSISVDLSGIGLTAWTYKSKVYSTGGSLLRYSSIDDPRDFIDGLGAGFINVPNQRKGDRNLVGVGEFQGFAAIFSREDAKLFSLNEDSDLNNYEGSVDNTGTFAARSIVPYGNTDLFYLDTSGIRSLRARAINNAAYAEDVGTLIDPFVKETLDALTEHERARAVGAIEPADGRFWLAIGERIFVFSFFPAKKISAWSYYEPGFAVESFARVGDVLYCRGGDKIYAYGGVDGATYPDEGETPAVARTPFLDGDAPANPKSFSKLHLGCENAWNVTAAFDPLKPDELALVGLFEQESFSRGNPPLKGRGVSVSIRAECSAAGYAKLSRSTIHYDQVG